LEVNRCDEVAGAKECATDIADKLKDIYVDVLIFSQNYFDEDDEGISN